MEYCPHCGALMHSLAFDDPGNRLAEMAASVCINSQCPGRVGDKKSFQSGSNQGSGPDNR